VQIPSANDEAATGQYSGRGNGSGQFGGVGLGFWHVVRRGASGVEKWATSIGQSVTRANGRGAHLTSLASISGCRGGSAHHPTSRRIFAAFNAISRHATHPRNKPTRHSQPAQLPCAIIAHSHPTPNNIHPQRREVKNPFVRPLVLIRLRTPQATPEAKALEARLQDDVGEPQNF
jgi:hypothetical protein